MHVFMVEMKNVWALNFRLRHVQILKLHGGSFFPRFLLQISFYIPRSCLFRRLVRFPLCLLSRHSVDQSRVVKGSRIVRKAKQIRCFPGNDYRASGQRLLSVTVLARNRTNEIRLRDIEGYCLHQKLTSNILLVQSRCDEQGFMLSSSVL